MIDHARILIDTDKLIEIEKGVEELPPGECYVSVIMVYEFIRVGPISPGRRTCWRTWWE
ncbi:MAG: hypothetical protein J7L11_08665 [Thermoprotei archaeon]|nr:hypothetical protein [Thermoprotei archaeon]